VEAAAKAATGVALVINNAGSFTGVSVTDGSLEDIRLEMETHYFGTLAVSRAFAPQLAHSGGGAILNVLSVLSWLTYPGFSAYSAAKSAQWSLTSALRNELAAQGTQVTALHVGYMNTDMVSSIDAPKSDPAVIAALSLDALEAGAVEILADEGARQTQANLSGGVALLYPPAA
jgi:NAD(P)-dependent dehydrogenase (short-subunit alcohol dehydrogenase family)